MTVITSLCVFCGSAVGGPLYREAAARLGALIAERNVRLIYGGGRVGLMGVIADAVLAAGGEVTGLIPRHLEDSEVGHGGLTELLVVDNMHERKRRMSELADGFVILPGGLGTLDETFEAITWKQLGLHDKPIVVADVEGYWRPLRDLVASVVSAGFAKPDAIDLVTFVDGVDEVFAALDAAGEPKVATALRQS